MDSLSPIPLPPPTVLYLVAYVAGFVFHVLFMHYVLAGTAVVAGALIFAPRAFAAGPHASPASLARDWLPAALSAAVTAGVAPLLFVQILYRRAFYTANLLLFHRWMSILLALVCGFYLLYLLKARAAERWPAPVRAAGGVLALACFLFTGYSWSENHLLSTSSEIWSTFYASGAWFFWSPQVPARLALALAAAFPTWAAWTLWHARLLEGVGVSLEPGRLRGLSALALWSLAIAALTAVLAWCSLDPAARAVLAAPWSRTWWLLGAGGLAAQAACWSAVRRRGRAGSALLALLWAALGVALLAGAALREGLRLARADGARLAELHERAAAAGGLGLALLCALLSGAAIVWIAVSVRRALRASPRGPAP